MKLRSAAKKEKNQKKPNDREDADAKGLITPASVSVAKPKEKSRKQKLKAAAKRLGTLKYLTTSTDNSPLQDMSRDFFVMQARDWLDWDDVARLDSAMCSREGRVALLEALGSGVVIYEGSKGMNDKLCVEFLQWLYLKGIGLRYLSVEDSVSTIHIQILT